MDGTEVRELGRFHVNFEIVETNSLWLLTCYELEYDIVSSETDHWTRLLRCFEDGEFPGRRGLLECGDDSAGSKSWRFLANTWYRT